MTTIQSGNTVDQSLLDTMNGSKKTGSSSIQDVQDRFMSLLVAQMKNQDPLNPMDNAAVTSQMAQLSTVTGIEKLNASMNTMSANMTASQTLQAASMIGHGVITPGNSLPLSGGKAVYALELPSNVDSLKVTVKDASGKVVRNLDLGAQTSGTKNLTWDGKSDTGAALPDDTYTYEVSGTAAGKKMDVTALCFGMVNSVSSGAGGIKLSVSGLGQISMADVRQIF